MNATVKQVLIISAKNALNAVLVTLPPTIHFHRINRAGLEYILWIFGSAVIAREATIWLPKLLAWSTSPTPDPPNPPTPPTSETRA